MRTSSKYFSTGKPGRIRARKRHRVRPTSVARPAGLIDCDQQPMEHISWLWNGRIPASMLSLLDGEGEAGKGTLLCDLMARVTRGDRMPFDRAPRRRPGAVLFLGTEEGLRSVVIPRLTVAGADLGLARTFDLARCPKLPDDLSRIADALRYTQQRTGVAVRFLVCDPLTGVLGRDVKIGHEQSYRDAASALTNFAEEHHVTILSTRHLTKNLSAPARYRGLGGLVVFNLARAVLGVAPAPDDPSTRVLVPLKSNNGPKAPWLRFRVVGKPLTIKGRTATYPAIEWIEECEPLRSADDTFKPATVRPTPVSDRARDLLLTLPATGTRQEQLFRAAAALDISEETLRDVAKELGVKPKRISVRGAPRGNGYWLWRLPDQGGNGETTILIPPDPGQGGTGPTTKLIASPILIPAAPEARS